tara:strand:+ start:99 stop:1799 length:1701 start_codon:yes stop_codon:yes gene_type:complete
MDEEQGLASPLAGGLRGIRRSVSSSVFAGGGRQNVQAQPDTITTNLLQQNSQSLQNVSSQLGNISAQVSGLNGSLLAIKDNLALSDQLERQREAAKQNREAILAEQGLREGKESQIESRIQSALTFPVRRLAQKTQFGLSRLANFFLILTGGWLTNTFINLIRASADGNIELLNQLKTTLTRALAVGAGTLLALSIGFRNILRGVGFLGSSALRLGQGGLLARPFRSIARGLRTGALVLALGGLVPSTGNKGVDVGLGVGIGGTIALFFDQFKNFVKGLFGIKSVQGATQAVGATAAKEGTKTVAATGFRGFLQKVALPLKGMKGNFITSFLVDFLIFGESFDQALAGAAGFAAGMKYGALVGAKIGAFFGGVGAGPGALIGGILGAFMGPGMFKGILNGIKSMFGFKVGKDEEEEENIEPATAQLGDETTVRTVNMNLGGRVFGPKINKDVVPAMLTPGEFVMTRETTDRIGASYFEALNKGGMVDKSITPVNKMAVNNVAENISNIDEGEPEIINFPMMNQPTQSGGTGGASGSSEPTNTVPTIGFDNNNPHTMFATSTYGANA